jgi:hypothetical protein
MLERLILHIGPPKTGTTSIQKFLSAAQADLLADGILYPANGRLQAGIAYRMWRRGQFGTRSGPSIEHHLLPWSLTESVQGVNAAACWMSVLEEIQTVNPRIAMVSAEDFAWLPETRIFQARELLADLPVHVVIYFRNQLHWKLSQYNQEVKVGVYRHSFRRFLQEGAPYNYLSFELLVKRYANVFGQDNVKIKPLDKIVSKFGLERDLIDTLGISYEKYAKYIPAKQFNISLPEKALNIICFLNLVEYHLRSRPFLKKISGRARRSIIHNSIAGRMFLAVVRPIFSESLYCDSDVEVLRDITKDWHPEFLCKYIDPEDHVYFQF